MFRTLALAEEQARLAAVLMDTDEAYSRLSKAISKADADPLRSVLEAALLKVSEAWLLAEKEYKLAQNVQVRKA